MTRPRRAADRPVLGIAFMLAFCAIAPLGDSIAKLLGGTIPLGQLLLVRFAAQAALLVPLVWLTGQSLALGPRVLRLTALRTLVHIAAIAAMFTALRYMPLADTVAIAFVMPLILLLLGHLVLGEQAGRHRLAACIVGFAGTLMVVQPGFAAVGPPALLPLAVALGFALFMLITRAVARDADAIAMQAASGLMATAMLGAAFLLAAPWNLPVFEIVRPAPRDMALLACIGLIGTLAHLLMTWSLRFAPAATLAPLQYLEIPVAVFFGWLIFSEIPNGLAAPGIAITIAAGLCIIWRERHSARARLADNPRSTTQ